MNRKFFTYSTISGVSLFAISLILSTTNGISSLDAFRLKSVSNDDYSISLSTSDLSNVGTIYKASKNENQIEFNRTTTSINNVTQITGLNSISFSSSNDYVVVTSGFSSSSLMLYERYIKNDGTNTFNVSLNGECFLNISSINTSTLLDITGLDIDYTCSKSTSEVWDTSRLTFTYNSTTSTYDVTRKSSAYTIDDTLKECAIPRYYDDGTHGKLITTLVEDSFKGAKFEKVYVPSSITKIPVTTFESCTELKEIYLPDSITSLGASAFLKCSKLTSIRLSENLLSIGNNCFESDVLLETIHIPDSVTTVGSKLFLYCDAIKNVNCPKGVTVLGGYTFYYCPAITTFTFTTNITEIGNLFFRNCDNIENIYYEGTIAQYKKINRYKAFYEKSTCPKIEEVHCSDGDFSL